MQDERPFVVIVAGPNGSGKSSLTRQLQAQGHDFGEYINPDDIAAGLFGSYDERVRQAQAIADTRRAEAIAARRRVDRAWILDNTVRAASRASFAGRLVATIESGIGKPVMVKTRTPLPAWVAQHLIEPARKRGWKIRIISGNASLLATKD
jgi:hypothetical protein